MSRRRGFALFRVGEYPCPSGGVAFASQASQASQARGGREAQAVSLFVHLKLQASQVQARLQLQLPTSLLGLLPKNPEVLSTCKEGEKK